MVNKNLITKYIVGSIFVVSYQIIIAPRTSILNTYADLAMILTVWIALAHGSNKGILFGFISGTLTGILIPLELGWSTLILSFIGYFTGIMKNKLVIDPMPSKVLVLIAAALAYNILIVFFTRFELFLIDISYVLSHILFSTINSVGVGIIIFIIFRYRYLLRNVL